MSNLDEPFDRICGALLDLIELIRAESGSTDHPSSEATIEEVALSAATTTDVDPKSGMKELDALTPAEATTNAFPQLVSSVADEAYHGVIVLDSSDLSAPTPTTCSTECPSHDASASVAALTSSAAPTSSATTGDVVPELAAPTPVTCSTDCSNQVTTTPSLTSPLTMPSLLPAVAPALVNPKIMQQGQVPRPLSWPSFKEAADQRTVVCWIPMVPKATSVPSQQIMRLMDVQLKLPWLSIPCKCRAVKVWTELLNGELTEDYYSSVALGSPVTISVDDVGLVEFIEHPFLIVHEHIIELASCFCLKKLWSTRDWWHHILEYAAVGGIHIPDKLHGTIQIISMSMHWQFMSQEEFKRSGRVDRGCIGFTLGRAALTSFHINNSACSSEQFSDLLVHRARSMVKHNGSRQPCSSSAEVPYWFDSFISRSPQIFWAMYYKLEVELKPSWLLQFFISPSTSCFCLLVVSATASSATGLDELESLHVDTWFESLLSSGAAIPESQLVNHIGCLEFVYFRQVDLGTDSVILWNPERGKEWTCLELKGWTTLNARTRNAKHQLHAYFSSDKQQCSGTYSSIPSAGGNHYQSVQSKGEEVPYLLRSWNDGVKQLSKEDLGIEFTIFMRNDLTRASMELLAYQLAGTIIAALILTIRSIRILAGIKQAIHMEVTHRSFLGQYWSFNLSNEHNSHISVRDSWVLLIIHAGKDVTINIVGKLFLLWDPGVLGIVF